MNLCAHIESVLQLQQPAAVIVRNGKCKYMKYKMHLAIIFDERRDRGTHAAKIMVIDAEGDMKASFYQCISFNSFNERSINFRWVFHADLYVCLVESFFTRYLANHSAARTLRPRLDRNWENNLISL